jgi:hypothetical protein
MALVRTDVSEERIASTYSVLWLLVTGNVPSSPIRVSLMMETIRSSETSDLTRTTRRNIPGDGILHGYRRERSRKPRLTTVGDPPR